MRPPSSPQSHSRFPLTRLLGSGSSVRVLRALATQGGPMSATQLAQECGLSRKGVHLILESLVGQQIVLPLGANKVQLFQLDREHPLVAGLQALFQMEQDRWTGLLQAVREVLRSSPEVQAAWYFGSVARGEDAPQSDFDIAMAIPDGGRVEKVAESVREALRPIEGRFYAAFSVIGLSNADIDRLHKGGDDWWVNVAQDARALKGMSPRQYAEAITK